jgi:hypothetical protein
MDPLHAESRPIRFQWFYAEAHGRVVRTEMGRVGSHRIPVAFDVDTSDSLQFDVVLRKDDEAGPGTVQTLPPGFSGSVQPLPEGAFLTPSAHAAETVTRLDPDHRAVVPSRPITE